MMFSERLRPNLDTLLGSKRNPKSLPYPKASLETPGSIRSLSQTIASDSPHTTECSLIVRLGHDHLKRSDKSGVVRFVSAVPPDLYTGPRFVQQAKSPESSGPGKGNG